MTSIRFRYRILWFLLVSLSWVLPPSAPARAADAPRHDKATRYRKSVPRESIQAGCAKVEVLAPVNTVLQVVNDFDHYASFIKRYKNGRIQLQVHARVIAHPGDRPDVYLEVPILRGAAKVWGVLRFDPLKVVDGEDVREGHLVRGNVERLDARWRVRKIDESRTAVSAELLIVPNVPVPHDLVTGEVEFVADVAVSGARDEAERRMGQQPSR